MISKISQCILKDSHQSQEQLDTEQAERVIVIHHRSAMESQAVQMRKRQLKEVLVVAFLTKFLKFVAVQQEKLEKKVSTDEGRDDIQDPFIKKSMERRSHYGRKVTGCYYATISPVSLPIQNLREVALLSKALLKILKDWIVSTLKTPKSTRKPALRRQSLKKISGSLKSSPRLSVDFSIADSTNEGVRPPSKQRVSLTRQPSTAFISKHCSMFLGANSLHQNDKLLESDLFQFENLNKGVNNITHHNSTYEFVAIKYIVGSTLTNSGILKADLLELENYEKHLSGDQRRFLVDLLQKVEAAITSINGIIVSHIRKQCHPSDAPQPRNSPQRLCHVPNSSSRLLADQFSKLYKQFNDNCEKYFTHQSNRLTLSNKVYRQLLQQATRARYGMMYLHRELLLIVRKTREGARQSCARDEMSRRHTTQLRILTNKYNMTTKHNKQNTSSPAYFSQHTSPNQKHCSHYSNSQAKRLIKMFRNGEFNLSKGV